MNRGIPTEETLVLMRESDPRVFCLAGTPHKTGRLKNSGLFAGKHKILV